MPLNPIFRAAQSEDLDQIVGLYRFLNPDDPAISTTEVEAIWRKLLRTDGVLVLLGEVDGRAVTTCTLVVVPNLTRGGRAYAFIENIVTHPD